MRSHTALRILSHVALGGIALAPPLCARVTLPAIISDHMVLQGGVAAPIWGWAEAGEEVKVTIAGQTKTAKPGADGRWVVKLDPLKAGDPLILTVQGQNTLTVKDVLVGEVWLGSGQSNMGLRVQSAKDLEQEQAAANHPEIRHFTEQSNGAETPQTIGAGQWVICTPQTVAGFSAALYFFGRDVQKEVGGAFGLINSSVGGTPIEAWIAAEAQEKTEALKPALATTRKVEAITTSDAAQAKYEKDLAAWKEKAAQAKAAGEEAPKRLIDPKALRARRGGIGGLYNGKIAPLIPYAIKGAIWYQGEANSSPDRARFYQYQLPLLVTDWRARWGEGDFPFAWAQLPNFDGGVVRDWPTVREAQLKSLSLPNTGMGINIDIGEEKNIHPKNKQEVGRRLALWALGTVYGKKVPSISGPLPAGHEVRKNEIVLAFQHADGGLVAKDGELKGFTVAGGDGKFVPAVARIEGGKVIVSSAEVPEPKAARYDWANWPDGNLYNGAGLPASPFRTDIDVK